MTPRAHHFQDGRLFDCYLAARHGEALDPTVAEHLTDCDACGTRYAEFARFMDAVRADGEAEADAIFTPERLRAQQQHIARRVEHVGRAARVISFPRQFVSRSIAGSTPHSVPRWIAAAAAAGLLLGLALGASYEWEWKARTPRFARSAQTGSARPAAFTPLATRGSDPAPAVAPDDAFLSELEVMLDRPRTTELQPFDVLTPHVREIRGPR